MRTKIETQTKLTCCLLITACVNPNGMSYTTLSNKTTRLEQYKKVLLWYLENTSLPIVFVENTGFDMSPFVRKYIDDNRIEVLTFQGNVFDKNLGKGYGEAQIIEYALNHAGFLSGDVMIIKVSGMCICGSIHKISGSCNRKDTVYALLFNDKEKGFMCISKVISAPIIFYKDYLLKHKEEINDSHVVYIEHVLFKSIKEWELNHRFKEFWFPLKISGMSGSSGQLMSPPKIDLSFYIHYFCHRLGYYGTFKFWK